MLGSIFSVVVYTPLYNALVFFIDIAPKGDVGIAVVLLTIAVKLLLLPLSIKAVKTQMVMRELEAPLKAIQEAHKDNRHKQAEEIMRLYREKKVNPFSSIFLILIQLPIIFGLYCVFYKGGLPAIEVERLYAFIPSPPVLSMNFLGLIDMGGRSALLAFLAGATQFYQAKLSLPELTPRDEKNASFKDDLARSFHMQMRYVLPVVVVIISYTISSAVALYWTTSNIMTIVQEWYARKRVGALKSSLQKTPSHS